MNILKDLKYWFIDRPVLKWERLMSERASLSVQRSCLAAQPSDEPVTDEPPHLADRRLAEIRRNLSGQMQFATELRDEARKGDPVWHRNEGVRVGLFNAICAIDNATAPAAEAREERPSGRPNDPDQTAL